MEMPFWKPSFSGSMLVFSECTPDMDRYGVDTFLCLGYRFVYSKSMPIDVRCKAMNRHVFHFSVF